MKIPLWAAAAIPAAAYVFRSIARGGDFSPDLPVDAILGVILLAAIGLGWWNRATAPTDDGSDELPPEVDDQHDPEGGTR